MEVAFSGRLGLGCGGVECGGGLFYGLSHSLLRLSDDEERLEWRGRVWQAPRRARDGRGCFMTLWT